ncbi:MAG: stalk domain-containing protein [Bacillota bacterium]
MEIVNSPSNNIESNINYKVFVDDSIIPLNGKKPLIINGSCFIPVRPAIEAMGYSGEWIEAENRYDIHVNRCTISVMPGSQIAKVNNQTVNMAGPVILEKGSLFVHPDFFNKVLSGAIFSDGKGKVEITSPFKLLIDSGFICLP